MTKLSFLLLAMLGFTAAACNTVEGAGRDVEAAGEGIQEGADDVEDDLND